MKFRILLILFALSAFNYTNCAQEVQSQKKPNIVFILADDLGYGDISSYNPNSKIITPNIDRLASNGVMFTDAHTSSSVCTPTRYGIITGRYNWRSTLKETVVYGYDKALIKEDRFTIADLLKKEGYHTAAIGKWHLGWDWANIKAGKKNVDFSKPISNGPTDLGFDYFYGLVGSLSMPPYVWVENNLPTMIPTRVTSNNIKQSVWLEGVIADNFVHEQVLPEMTQKAVQYINEHSNEDKPFFLYLPLTAPHNPVLPTPKFKGKSGIDNPYPDFVLMVDWVVDEITKTLKKNGVLDNTILIFTSDNGCSDKADFKQLATVGHFPSYVFRGYKSDIYEGGHRVPYIVSWPKKIEPSISEKMLCTTDLFATVAEILDCTYDDNTAEDSFSFTSALGLSSTSIERTSLVHHSINGSFAYRRGNWKVCFTPDSGGWSEPRPDSEGIELLPLVQLYNLEEDISEKINLQDKHPEIVEKFRTELGDIVKKGRSTKGEPQKNDGPSIWPQLYWMKQ